MCISSNPAAGWWCCGMACRPIAADLCWTGSQANARGCPSNACLATRRSSIRPSKSLATSNPASSPTCVAIPSLRSRQAPKTAWIASAATHDSASRSFVTPASAYDQTPPAITRTSLIVPPNAETAACIEAGRRDGPSAVRHRRLVGGSEGNDVAVVTSAATGEPLVFLDEGEDDRVQHLRTLFQFRMLPAQTGKFLIGVATRSRAWLRAGDQWRQALFDLLSELVAQVDGAVSGCLADASERRDVLPGELGVGWRDGAVEK